MVPEVYTLETNGWKRGSKNALAGAFRSGDQIQVQLDHINWSATPVYLWDRTSETLNVEHSNVPDLQLLHSTGNGVSLSCDRWQSIAFDQKRNRWAIGSPLGVWIGELIEGKPPIESLTSVRGILACEVSSNAKRSIGSVTRVRRLDDSKLIASTSEDQRALLIPNDHLETVPSWRLLAESEKPYGIHLSDSGLVSELRTWRRSQDFLFWHHKPLSAPGEISIDSRTAVSWIFSGGELFKFSQKLAPVFSRSKNDEAIAFDSDGLSHNGRKREDPSSAEGNEAKQAKETRFSPSNESFDPPEAIQRTEIAYTEKQIEKWIVEIRNYEAKRDLRNLKLAYDDSVVYMGRTEAATALEAWEKSKQLKKFPFCREWILGESIRIAKTGETDSTWVVEFESTSLQGTMAFQPVGAVLTYNEGEALNAQSSLESGTSQIVWRKPYFKIRATPLGLKIIAEGFREQPVVRSSLGPRPLPHSPSAIDDKRSIFTIDQVKDWIVEVRKLDRDRKIAPLMRSFADQVTYYGKRYTKEDLRSHLEKYYLEWPSSSNTIQSDSFELRRESDGKWMASFIADIVENNFDGRQQTKTRVVIELKILAADNELLIAAQSSKPLRTPTGAGEGTIDSSSNETRFTDSQVKRWVIEVRNYDRDRQLAQLMKAFADQVYYYGKKYSKEALQAHLEGYYLKWPTSSNTIHPDSFIIKKFNDAWNVTFTADIAETHADRERQVNATVNVVLQILQSDSGLLISSQQSTRINN